MAKKTKAQRQAIRKSGWEQAKKGFQQALKGNIDGIAQLGRDAVAGAITGFVDPKKTMLKGIGENVSDSVRKGNYKGKTSFDGVKDMVVGVVKGIFNDPEFYNAWVKPVLAYNDNRPMEPDFVDNIDKLLPGLGVGYIVDTNVKMVDLINNEAANFSIDKLMQQIRDNLKSNLPYTRNKLKAYVLQSISICVILTQIGRNLSANGYYDATAPRLNAALKHISNDTPGFNDASRINYLTSQEDYSYAISRVDLVNAMVDQFMIPPRMRDFIEHYFGSFFVDQTAKHAQIYRLNCTEVPLYIYNPGTDEVSVSGIIDPNNVDLDSLVSMMQESFNTFGLQIADAGKSNLLGTLNKIDPYHMIMKYDKSFFNLLVNAYTTICPTSYAWETGDGAVQGDDAGTYFRVDFMEDLPEQSRVDLVMGLGSIIGNYWNNASGISHDVHFLEVKSQSIIVYAPVDSVLPGNDQYAQDSPTGTANMQIPLETITSSGFKTYTITSDIVKESNITVVAPSSTPGGAVIETWDLSNPTGLSTDTSTTINVVDGTVKTFTISAQYGQTHYPLFDVVTNSTSQGYVGYRYALNLTTGALSRANVTVGSGRANVGTYISVISAASCTAGTAYYGYVPYTITFSSASPTVSDTYLLAAIRSTYSIVIVNKANCFYSGTVTRKAGSTSTAFGIKYNSSFPQDMTSWFIEVVDYHIPLWIQTSQKLTPYVGTTRYAGVTSVSTQFVKECYIPTVLNINDVSYTLYNMVMSLFAPNRPKSIK